MRYLYSHIFFVFAAVTPLDSTDAVIMGIYDTQAGGNSRRATPDFGISQYLLGEAPPNAADGDLSTKYRGFGTCSNGDYDLSCGLNTGFYLVSNRDEMLITGFQVCTANDHPERDPMTVTLEGTNRSERALIFGSNWNLIYSGNCGLSINPDRNTCGLLQPLNNSIYYKNYRFLVSSKRHASDSVQYSEVKLFG
ncbi:unnamed protein product [Adineta steineri]|uniref:Uncharacterized protein n=1 Tax=Adineta steineri TaxID=433720 RepID=A0A819NNX8_9BILA|nr:unnamed protein product [Adineta steineri]CAF3999936.1 unnamed protein product [Adineta steineri]